MTLSVSHRYRSPLVDIHDFACSAPAGHCSGEEAAAADEIAIIRRGVFRKRAADGVHLVDPTRVAVFGRDQPYVVDHPGRDGDHSTVLAFAAETLNVAMAGLTSDSTSSLSQLPSTIPLQRELLLAFHFLLAALRRMPLDDLLVDDCAMLALDAFRTAVARHSQSRLQPLQANRSVEAARELLSERWMDRLTIADLAREIGVSPFHLCRRFRDATGVTVHRYVTMLRMAAALERIGEYRDSLAQLALDLGYSSHSHFTTAFRVYFDMPPSAAAGERFLAMRKILKARASPLQ